MYASHGVRLVDNTPEEILDLTKEMFEVLTGKAVYTAEDERRQRRFVELRNESEPFPSPTLTRVGREFLRKYDRFLYRPHHIRHTGRDRHDGGGCALAGGTA